MGKNSKFHARMWMGTGICGVKSADSTDRWYLLFETQDKKSACLRCKTIIRSQEKKEKREAKLTAR